MAIDAGERFLFVFIELVAMELVVEDDSRTAPIGIHAQRRMAVGETVELNFMADLALVVALRGKLVIGTLMFLMANRTREFVARLQRNAWAKTRQAESIRFRRVAVPLLQAFGGS